MADKFTPKLRAHGKTLGLEIKHYADVSIDNLMEQDVELLTADAAETLNAAKCREAGVEGAGIFTFGVVDYTEGFIVWLGRSTSKKYVDDALWLAEQAGYSDKFRAIVCRAMLAGCSTLMFDRDASPVD